MEPLEPLEPLFGGCSDDLKRDCTAGRDGAVDGLTGVDGERITARADVDKRNAHFHAKHSMGFRQLPPRTRFDGPEGNLSTLVRDDDRCLDVVRTIELVVVDLRVDRNGAAFRKLTQRRRGT